ncbi:uncharacterized protein LOC111616097 [Centruroides sculpturatus]|uniref:uncharacterized protein LOC111616097 n=1 Tax=Centruroides sculpturatus TaxID=218467 RepID=UPI000C6D29A3|nr:uncharacterized protein LOC111616097 [Centruroides sculpturatus]
MAKRPKVSETDDETPSEDMEVSLQAERVLLAESIRDEIQEYMMTNNSSKMSAKHTTFIIKKIDKIIDILRDSEEDPLRTVMDSINQKLDKVLSAPTTKPVQSYAQVVSKKVKQQPKEILLVEPEQKGGDPERAKDRLKQNINPRRLGVGIQAMRKLRRGRIEIKVNTAEEKRKLREEIEEKTGLKTREPVKRRPRIVIYGVAKDAPKEEVEECLFEQNEIINSNLDINKYRKEVELKFKYGSREKRTVNSVAEISPRVRQLLMAKKEINLCWSRCGIEEYINVTQCYKCCKIGHIAKNCVERDVVSSQCGQNHKFKDCPNKARADCCNCRKEKLKDTNHNTCDKKCPLIQKVRCMIMAKIDYGYN